MEEEKNRSGEKQEDGSSEDFHEEDEMSMKSAKIDLTTFYCKFALFIFLTKAFVILVVIKIIFHFRKSFIYGQNSVIPKYQSADVSRAKYHFTSLVLSIKKILFIHYVYLKFKITRLFWEIRFSFIKISSFK